MILAIDIGNTNIVLGGVDGETTVFYSRISTDHNKTADEYAIVLSNIFKLHGINRADIDGCILSSVVPDLTNIFKIAVTFIPGKELIVIGPGLKTGLNILIDNPSQLGSDLVVAAVAALHKYSGTLVIFDFGTATTISVVRGNGDFLGAVILPGVRVSFDALTSRTSQLPSIGFEPPKHVIGTNSVDSMQSGLVYGNASMVDGMIDRIEEELGESVTVIATGGLAQAIIPNCRHKVICDDNLLLTGLKLIYDKNSKLKRKNY